MGKPELICHLCAWRPPKGESAVRCPNDGAYLISTREHAKAPNDPYLGRVLGGRFPILGILGLGGMGAVYRSQQRAVRRHVAIKVISPVDETMRDTRGEELKARFMREARLIAELDHPGVVTLHDFGSEADGTLYMVMEYVDGRPLSRVLKLMPPRILTEVAIELLSILGDAHEKGLVHRDIKPDNIMILGRDKVFETAPGVKLLDFGIAKRVAGADSARLTNEGTRLGTPHYMSPEQARGVVDVDGRSDLYSVGVILYKGVAGTVPFTDVDPVQLILKVAGTPPPPLPFRADIPEDLVKVIDRALAKRPEERYAHAAEMIAALKAVDWDSVQEAEPPPEFGTVIQRDPEDGPTVASDDLVADGLVEGGHEGPTEYTPASGIMGAPARPIPEEHEDATAHEPTPTPLRRVRAELDADEGTTRDQGADGRALTGDPISEPVVGLPPLPDTSRDTVANPAASEVLMRAAEAPRTTSALPTPQAQRPTHEVRSVGRSRGPLIGVIVLAVVALVGGVLAGVLTGGVDEGALKQARARVQAEAWSEALTALEPVLTEEPEHPEAVSLKARATREARNQERYNDIQRFVQARQFSAALGALEALDDDSVYSEKVSGLVTSIQRGFVDAELKRARVLMEEGAVDEARKVEAGLKSHAFAKEAVGTLQGELAAAERRSLEFDALLKEARAHRTRGDLQMAADTLVKAQRLQPRDVLSVRRLCQIYQQMKAPGRAMPFCERWQGLATTDADRQAAAAALEAVRPGNRE